MLVCFYLGNGVNIISDIQTGGKNSPLTEGVYLCTIFEQQPLYVTIFVRLHAFQTLVFPVFAQFL